MQLEPKAKSPDRETALNSEIEIPQPAIEHECFLCGRHQSKTISLRLIRRWKLLSRKMTLIIDHVCNLCDDKHKLISSTQNNERN